MYGLIGKIKAVPGQRDALVAILLDRTSAMPGCLSYVVAKDPTDADAIWVTEAWTDRESHKASLSLPSVQQAIAKARPLIAGFGERFETQPIGGPSLASNNSTREPIVLPPGEGRPYLMGRIAAVFKADGAETTGKYSISEWWLEARTQGPGAHSHAEDDVFYVLEGTMSFLVDGNWIDAEKGSFVLMPAGSTHDFENRSGARAGVLNFSAPGNFEEHMPGIVQWFSKHPPRDAGSGPTQFR